MSKTLTRDQMQAAWFAAQIRNDARVEAQKKRASDKQAEAQLRSLYDGKVLEEKRELYAKGAEILRRWRYRTEYAGQAAPVTGDNQLAVSYQADYGRAWLLVTFEPSRNNGAGRIDRDWWDNSLLNAQERETVVGWFQTSLNSLDVEIDDQLRVWDGRRWLNQDEIDQECKLIDAGV